MSRSNIVFIVWYGFVACLLPLSFRCLVLSSIYGCRCAAAKTAVAGQHTTREGYMTLFCGWVCASLGTARLPLNPNSAIQNGPRLIAQAQPAYGKVRARQRAVWEMIKPVQRSVIRSCILALLNALLRFMVWTTRLIKR